jgi:hypothetical protein
VDPDLLQMEYKMIVKACSYHRPCPVPHLLIVDKGEKHVCQENINAKGSKVRTANNVHITNVHSIFDCQHSSLDSSGYTTSQWSLCW